MARTSKRPIVSGEVSATNAFYFASLLTVISLTIFSVFTNVLATVLTGAAIVIYVFGYTIVLKRRTDQNIVWGGIAGCMPVLIGWAAIADSLSLTAWLFFLVVFFWTPPHFWALAIKYKDDYSAAGIPMLPVVAPINSVRNQTWFHSIAMVLTSLGTVWAGKLHWSIMALTLILGIQFLRQVKDLHGAESGKAAARLFQWSITYLSAFSLALVIGALFLNP
jgi:protoheme IX farnesyltransferase